MQQLGRAYFSKKKKECNYNVVVNSVLFYLHHVLLDHKYAKITFPSKVTTVLATDLIHGKLFQ